ncbi:MAG: MATE family efflux transporter [Ruminococcaceae bacterium]|nr:MATE family efflux transporter [Oscillospiraceae bacterium]
MVATQKRTPCMTEGPLFGKILLFVLPLMATNLLQTLYNAADMMVVGLSSEPDAVGAIGITGPFINLVLNIFVGFATGANVVVARHLGAREDERASRTVHTSLVIALLFGTASMLIGLLISRPVLAMMGAEGKLLDLATLYTEIYFLGIPFLALTNYLIAIFRAKGDTKTPLYILAVAGILNVLLNLFFVMAVGLSVEGVALATMISNIFSALFLLFKLARDRGACRFRFRLLCFDRFAFKNILYIGVPAGIQGSLFSIANMMIQSSVLQVNNAMVPLDSPYQPVVKGCAAAGNLEGFAYTAQNAVYQAAITFTSQNAGAAKYERIRRVMLCCYTVTFCIAVLFSATIFLLRAPLLALYDVVPGEAGTLELIAFDAAQLRMIYMYSCYFLLAFMETGCGILRGLGRSISSTVISLLGACVFRIIWLSTIFRAIPTLDIIYLSYPISWFLTALAQFLCAVVALRHLIRTRLPEIHP